MSLHEVGRQVYTFLGRTMRPLYIEVYIYLQKLAGPGQKP